MLVANSPQVVAAAQAANQPDVIEILGVRADQEQKIDRRTYRVQQTPQSAQKDAIQLLRGVPAVTVSSDNTIMLLGSGNVNILIDGRPYPGNVQQYLRTLHGEDVGRIEVITNPSGQYSAEGTGGLINFILRRKRGEGLSGSATAELSSLVGGEANMSLKYKQKKFVYGFEANAGTGADSRSRYLKLRTLYATPGANPTINYERSDNHPTASWLDASASVRYEIDTKTSLSAKLEGADYGSRKNGAIDYTGLTVDFPSFTERRHYRKASSFVMADLNFDHKGSRESETLTADLNFYGHPRTLETTESDFSNESALSIRRWQRLLGVSGQADWQHPIGNKELLSIGGSFNSRELSERYQSIAAANIVSASTEVSDHSSFVTQTLAAYATFQHQIGSWVVMPGVRIERNNRRISSPAAPKVEISRTDLFPTFHLRHRMGKRVDLTVSYSKRIDRAQAEMLRPYSAVEDVLTSVRGNPRLKDQSTDAYEVNLHYHRGKTDAALIVYDRETSHLWSTDYIVENGRNIYSFINSGRSRDTGAELDVTIPISKALKANASLNLFDERTPVDATQPSAEKESVRYTANATLEWDGPDRGNVPADVAQVQVEYHSKSRNFQFRYDTLSRLDASYTHSLSRTISVTGSVAYTSPTRYRLLAFLLHESYWERSPIVVRLKVLKTFGRQ